MRIFGIDPSVRVLGWGVVEMQEQSFRYIASDTLYTNPAETVSVRLGKLFKKLDSLLDQYLPNVVALEGIFVQNDPSATFKLGYVQGIVMAMSGMKGIPLKEMAPTLVKKTLTGTGRAGKDQVRSMVLNVLGNPGIKFSSYDESDALAIAYAAGVCTDVAELI
jgi:crossover junction endodeoxyribonuclease RuvC